MSITIGKKKLKNAKSKDINNNPILQRREVH